MGWKGIQELKENQYESFAEVSRSSANKKQCISDEIHRQRHGMCSKTKGCVVHSGNVGLDLFVDSISH